ncbi:MAG: TonB-dependent receptor [Thermodesulfobacteriota bacterium]|nr:TonB-dependent receptor [Thermodesulfobacteriota bacterium]
MKKGYLFVGICILCIIFHVQSFAETIVLEEIIVRGEREVSQEECLDIREVRETPARDVGEALKVIEGISAVRKGAIANDIVLRGFQRDNINVLIDGMRIYGACPNRMDPNSFHIDFAEIEEISVLKGPFDVRNPGSLGGLIEIKTMKPGKGWGGTSNISVGSYENVNASINTSYGSEKTDVLFGYVYRYSLPYKDGNDERITEQYPASSTSRYRDEDVDDKAYSIDTYWSKFGLNFPNNQRMEISYTRQEAEDIIYPYLLMDAVYDDTDRLNVTYEASDLPNRIERLKAQFYWNQVRHDMTDSKRVSSLDFASGYMMRCYAEAETFGGKVESDIVAHTGELTIGVDYYLRNWDADNTLPIGEQKMMPDVDSRNIGTYLEYKQSITENFRLTMGARFDHNKTRAHDDRSALYSLYHGTTDREEVDFCGSGNVQLLYTPAKTIELFAGLGHTTRPPGPDERYIALEKPEEKPNWVGNPELDPVRNREFDIGIKYSGDRFYGKATFFYSDIKDFITVYDVQGPDKDARSFRNVDATLYGGETSLNLFLPYDLCVQAGFSYTRGRDDTFDKPLLEIPPLQGRIAVRYDTDRYFTEIEGIFADDQHRIDSELNEEKTHGWGIVNLKMGMVYKKFNVFCGIHNIFDRQYFDHLSYQRDPFRTGIKVPEIGRDFYLNLTYSW